MKRVLFFMIFLLVVGLNSGMTSNGARAYQDPQEELIPSEDSVSVDDLDPIFYEAEEDEATVEKESDNSLKLILGLVGAGLVVGLGFLFVNRSRSKKEK